MSIKQNNCSIFRIHRNTNTRQITALTPILSERKNARSQFLLKARCMGQHRAIKAAASCAGSCRTAAVFCGNYAVLPNGCLAPLVFGLSGSLRNPRRASLSLLQTYLQLGALHRSLHKFLFHSLVVPPFRLVKLNTLQQAA